MAASLNGYPNIAIFYSRFLEKKKNRNENGSLQYTQDIEKLLESEKNIEIDFYANLSKL